MVLGKRFVLEIPKAPVVPTPKPAPGIGFQLQHTHRKQTVCLTNKLGLTDCDGPREPPLPGQWIIEKGALQSTADASDPRCCIKIHETAHSWLELRKCAACVYGPLCKRRRCT